MPVALHHPDLAAPPAGWNAARVGSQIHLQPSPGGDDAGPATIVISPLVARHKGLPPMDQLIVMALEAEQMLRFQLTDRVGPTTTATTTGLQGCFYEVRGTLQPAATVERRIYVMYADALCYYGIHYLAAAASYERHLKSFWDAARSLKPFAGRVMTQPVAASAVAVADDRALANPYKD